MPRIIWTDPASQDVLRAFLFLEEIDADAAAKAVQTIVAGAGGLRRFPHIGRPAEDLEPEQKELLIPFGTAGYVLLYECAGQDIHVLAVRHQKEAGY